MIGCEPLMDVIAACPESRCGLWLGICPMNRPADFPDRVPMDMSGRTAPRPLMACGRAAIRSAVLGVAAMLVWAASAAGADGGAVLIPGSAGPAVGTIGTGSSGGSDSTAVAAPAQAGAATPSAVPDPDRPTLVAVVPADVLADYRRWLGGRDPLTINDFRGPGARRDVVEVALMQQALVAGGCKDSVTFVEAPSYARELVELAGGRAAVSSTTAWGNDVLPADSGVVASPAMIDSGDFLAGCYTTATDTVAMHAQDRADLARLRFVSCHDWSADWRALTILAPAELEDVATWSAMPRMVAAGRADVLLAPFQSTPDLSMVVDGITLVPIPGLAVALAGSRHYATARNASGASAAAALAIGVPKLRADGVVLRAYQQSGFYNPAVIGWKRIVL